MLSSDCAPPVAKTVVNSIKDRSFNSQRLLFQSREGLAVDGDKHMDFDLSAGIEKNCQHYLRVLNLNEKHVVLQFADVSLSTGNCITGTTGFVIDGSKAFKLDEETGRVLPGLGNKLFAEVWPTWHRRGGPKSNFLVGDLADAQYTEIPGWVGFKGKIFDDKFASGRHAQCQRITFKSQWIELTVLQRKEAMAIAQTIKDSESIYRSFNRHMYGENRAVFWDPHLPLGRPSPNQRHNIDVERIGREQWSAMEGHDCQTYATAVFNGITGLKHRLQCTRNPAGIIICEVLPITIDEEDD